jgi:hypothetical protein
MEKSLPRKKFLKLAGTFALTPLLFCTVFGDLKSDKKSISTALEKLDVINPCGSQVIKEACILLKNQKSIIVVCKLVANNHVKLQALKFAYKSYDEKYVFTHDPIEESLIMYPKNSIKILNNFYGMELKSFFRRPNYG